MRSLELKVPPVALTLTAGLVMAVLAWLTPTLRVGIPGRRVVGMAVALAGLAVCAIGVASFRSARTTVNPLAPESATSLVRSGIYAHTRNPMYLGMALMLLGWGLFLSNLNAIAVVPLAILYLDRFQIVPEERALAALFGDAFRDYASHVRRWL